MSQLGVAVRHLAGKREDSGSSLCSGLAFSSKIVVYGHRLVTLPCAVNETLNITMAHITAHLDVEIILVVTV